MQDETETGGSAAPKTERVIDTVNTPTIYANGIYGMQLRDGVATINLTQHVFPAPGSDLGEPFNQTVLRLAIPVPAFVKFADWFMDTKAHLIASGAITPIEGASKEDG
jgi:hypothetical protein